MKRGPGRPPLPPGERRSSRSFRLSEEEVVQLEALGNGWESWRDVLRRLIRESVQGQPGSP